MRRACPFAFTLPRARQDGERHRDFSYCLFTGDGVRAYYIGDFNSSSAVPGDGWNPHVLTELGTNLP